MDDLYQHLNLLTTFLKDHKRRTGIGLRDILGLSPYIACYKEWASKKLLGRIWSASLQAISYILTVIKRDYPPPTPGLVLLRWGISLPLSVDFLNSKV